MIISSCYSTITILSCSISGVLRDAWKLFYRNILKKIFCSFIPSLPWISRLPFTQCISPVKRGFKAWRPATKLYAAIWQNCRTWMSFGAERQLKDMNFTQNLPHPAEVAVTCSQAWPPESSSHDGPSLATQGDITLCGQLLATRVLSPSGLCALSSELLLVSLFFFWFGLVWFIFVFFCLFSVAFPQVVLCLSGLVLLFWMPFRRRKYGLLISYPHPFLLTTQYVLTCLSCMYICTCIYTWTLLFR